MGEIIGQEQVIASAKMELGLSGSHADLLLSKWCDEGVRSLSCLSIFKTLSAELEVIDGRAKLPCGFHKFVMLRTSCGDARFDNWVYADIPFLTSCQCDITDLYTDWSRLFNIQDGYIILSSDVGTDTLSLVYEGLNVDENGLMKIDERYERALTAYMCYKYARKNFNIYPVNVRQDFQTEWVAQKRYLQGADQATQWALDKRRVYLTIFNRVYISPR